MIGTETRIGTLRSRSELSPELVQRLASKSRLKAVFMSNDDEPKDVAPHQSQNRESSDSKRRRSKRHCPVCLSRLAKIASRTRLLRSCALCGAHPSDAKSCLRCGASGSIWENKQGAACRACGLHGQKSSVIAALVG
jgi:hypothetical protein